MIHFSIGLRYLRAARRSHSISTIGIVALLGVSLGVAALMVGMAMMDGYRHNLLKAMSGAFPHLTVRSTYDAMNEQQIREELQKVMGDALQFSELYTLNEALISGKNNLVRGVVFRGIELDYDPLAVADSSYLNAEALEAFQLPEDADYYPVLMSPTLAEILRVTVGDSLHVVDLEAYRQGKGLLRQRVNLRLVGLVASGMPTIDSSFVIARYADLVRIFKTELPPSIGLHLTNPLDFQYWHQQLDKQEWLGENVYIYSWLESNKRLFQLIQTQKQVLYVVLLSIVLIAYFGMLCAISLLVREKRREIAILRSLGLAQKSVKYIFIVQGLLIGLLGSALGIALGMALCWSISNLLIIDFPAYVYPGSESLPINVAITDLIWIVGATLVISLLSTWIPAKMALKFNPVEALRFYP